MNETDILPPIPLDEAVRAAHEAVDIQQGHEMLAKTRAAVEIFAQEYLPTLPVGEKTRAALETKITQDLTAPEGIRISHDNGAVYGEDDPTSPIRPATITVGQEFVGEVVPGWIDEAVAAAGVDVAPAQKEMLAYNWVVWHELGHGLQDIYRAENPTPDGSQTSLAEDMLAQGVATRVFPNGNSTYQAATNISSEEEAFPEGFSQMLLEDYTRRHLGFTPTQSAAFRAGHVASRQDPAEVLKSELLAADAHLRAQPPRDKDEEASWQTSFAYQGTYLGYAAPSTPAQAQQILEKMP